ncbi:hypothetical protein [Chamaesiphon minutus]|uniref:Uncharacterized protein n=1 Tax=Chamaesiphon minutus (strain ATCC 27169 / PCC 6605) TaxID=1173020 RepID=K9URQ4_CHAP6|nr:hypothetical protein [Chamaesiphon minutus]AFY97151.1 hypothetical protein Cha6605_6328 [Chamaesiphon minutus PCC 6605]
MLETNKDDKTKEIQQIDDWAHKLGYNLGFWIGANLVGATAGLILGALSILKHSQNEAIQRETAAISERARLDKISMPDLDRLAQGEKLSDTNYRHAAIFIDRLEQLTGSLDRGRQLERDYIFYKSVTPNGAINYTVKDSKSERTLLDFDVDRDGKIAVQVTQGTDAERQLMKFVNLASERLSLDLNLLTDERERMSSLERDLASFEDSIQSIDSVDLERLATAPAVEQSQYIEDLEQTNDLLAKLQLQARAIGDLIRTAQNANAREQQRHPQTLHQIEVSHLANKLIGLEQRIDRIGSQLQNKPQTVDAIKTWQPAAVVETSIGEVAALRLKVAALERQLQAQNQQPAPKTPVKSRSTSPTTQQTPNLQSTITSQFAPPPPPYGSTFGEEEPEIPVNLHKLNSKPNGEISSTEPQSPANGRPITVLQPEAPDLEPAEGIEQ